MADISRTKSSHSRPVVQEEGTKRVAIKRYRRCSTAPSNGDGSSKPASATTSGPSAKSLFPKVHPSFRWVGLVLTIYLGIGTICFFLVRDQIDGKKTNGFVDALYFCIVTMTTVGYGDLVPSSDLSKLMASAYVFVGTIVIGFILSKAANYLVEKQQALIIKALYGSGEVGEAAVLKNAAKNKEKNKFIVTTLILVFLFVIGTIFLCFVEKLSFVDAFYCVFSTITTLGYGEKSFSSKGGRVFAIIWILAGTIFLAQFYLYLAEMLTERKRRELADMVLKRRMTFVDLEAADLDCDGEVGAAEFVIYKLKEMGKIEQNDVATVLEQFEVLDVDQNGTLTRKDLLISQSIGRQ